TIAERAPLPRRKTQKHKREKCMGHPWFLATQTIGKSNAKRQQQRALFRDETDRRDRHWRKPRTRRRTRTHGTTATISGTRGRRHAPRQEFQTQEQSAFRRAPLVTIHEICG